jgi:phosphotriesterase-related protein
MNSMVMSVNGAVSGRDLGRTLVHEHIIISMPGEELDPLYAPDRREIVAIATDRLQELRDNGVSTLVDPCPIELGRDPELYATVAEKSGVNIIFATGFYFEQLGIPPYWRARDAEEVAEFYLHEISQGVGKTGLRPGVIKAATGAVVTETERRLLAGAAMAQKEAGIAIITHTEHALHGDVQQEIFAANGADLSRVLVGHQDEQVTVDPIIKLAERGSFVAIDRVGNDYFLPDERRADLVAALLREDHTHRVCLSQDCVCTMSAARFPWPLPPGIKVTPAEMMKNNKPWSYVVTGFAALLRERGVTEQQLDILFRDNPRRLLTGEA